jgi:hypothetical protein
MTGERAWVAPEMTPAVDPPEEHEAPADRRGVARGTPPDATPEPGEVPGIGGRVEGRSQLSDTTGAERTDEGDGAPRRPPAP